MSIDRRFGGGGGGGSFAPLASPALTGAPTIGGVPITVPQGVWAASTAYTVGQMVIYGGCAHRCTTAHTSGPTFDSTNWEAWSSLPAPTPVRPKPIASAMATTVTTFQPSHGWTASGATAADDTTTSGFLGTQSLKMTTNGAGGSGRVEKASLATFDISKVSIAVLIRVADMTKINVLQARIGSGAAAGWQATLYAPTSVQQALNSGVWTWLTFDVANASTIGTPPALNACTYIAIQASDLSAGAAVINIGAIKLIPKPSTIFPNGVVSLAFDDGYVEHYTTAKPYLDKYGFAATEYPICDLVASGGQYCSIAQLQELQNNSGWEIQAHAARLADHNAAGGFSSLTAAQLDAEARDMMAWASANGFPVPWHHAYPQGYYNNTVKSVMGQYFAASRTIDFMPCSMEMMPSIKPMEIRCQPFDTRSTATFTGLIDQAYANGDWLILYTHKVVASGATGTQILTANFQTVVDYLNTKGIPVRTVGDVLQATSVGRP